MTFGPARWAGIAGRGAERHANAILGLVERKSVITLAQLQAALAEQGVTTSLSSLWRLFVRRRITRTSRAAPDVLIRRQAWFDGQLDLERLVFIDETGASTKMARRHGRAPRGQRLWYSVPHGHWKTTTFVGALRLSGMTAPMVLDGPMNGAWFLAHV